MAERKYIRWTRQDNGRTDDRRYINSSKLYADANVERIYVWLVKLYQKTFVKFQLSNNEWMAELFNDESRERALRGVKYPAPDMLFHVNAVEPLFNPAGKLLFYNRRIRDGGCVYVTAQ